MNKHILLSSLLVLLLSGCQKPETPSIAVTPTPKPTVADACCSEMDSAPASEMSIYNLESAWQDQQSQQLKLENFKGEVVLLALVYSSCKAACPMILEDMRKIGKEVDSKHLGKLRYVLVSIDPEVDTPERLKAFSEEAKLGPSWSFLHGDGDDVLELAALLGVKYTKTSETDFAHSNLITVLNSKGEIVHQQEGLGVEPAATVRAIETLLTDHG